MRDGKRNIEKKIRGKRVRNDVSQKVAEGERKGIRIMRCRIRAE